MQPWLQYPTDVAEGKILACKYVKKACERFLREYKEQDGRWVWNQEAADHILKFMSFCTFVEGPLAGKQLVLEPWQEFILANAYGWRDISNPEKRRFTRMIIQVGRKNSKTTLLAAWGLYELLFAPDGSQLYSVATGRDQAKLVWSITDQMYQKMDQRITGDIKTTYDTISIARKWNRFSPLSRESKRLDGLNARFAIIDEAAAVGDANLIQVLTSSMGAQTSPMTVFISTAQPRRDTLYYETLEHSKRVLDEAVDDDRLFSLPYELDDESEWDKPEMWIKANPNLNVSVSEEFLLDELKQAQSIPAHRNNFLIKYCNVFTANDDSWIDVDTWNLSKVPMLKKEGNCYIGLDMSKSRDLTSIALVWVSDEHFEADVVCYLPRESMQYVPKHALLAYEEAIAYGSLILTDGEVIDHRILKHDLMKLCEKYNVEEIAYDPYKSVQLMTELDAEGLPMIQQRQGRISFGPGIAETERLILDKKIHHLDNKFLAWQIGNTKCTYDIHDLPNLEKGVDNAMKIDGVVALAMAVTRAVAHGGLQKPQAPRVTLLSGKL